MLIRAEQLMAMQPVKFITPLDAGAVLFSFSPFELRNKS